MDGTEEDDATLVARARAGEPRAFAVIVHRYRRLVAALVARTAPPGADAETDDLVQEVFLDAYRGLAALDDPRRFKGWLVGIALNRARAVSRRRRVEAAARPRLGRSGAAAKDAGDAVERAEERERLLAALGDLPDDARAVVTLRYLQGLSAPEIADVLGLRPEAVRMRLSRALRGLRERLLEEEAP